jgi:hypothetical protein
MVNEKILQRFDAWWHGEILDRPPVTLGVKPTRPCRGPVSRHSTLRERWLDVEFNVEAGIAGIERIDFAGDSFPVFCPNIGPEITATLFGCELEFGEHTSWSRPIIEDPDGWELLLTKAPDFDNIYWQAAERMAALAIERCDGRYVVGMTDLHGSYDILAGLRDPERLCMDLIDCPDIVRRAGRHVSQGFVEAFNRAYGQVAAAGHPATCWTPFCHAGPAYVPSCDFWCMLSGEMARDFVLPDILVEIEPLERSIFHLDGPQALKHLDLLLELPHLNAVQWVFGAGQGPAARWIDVYRRILEAGKSVQVFARDPADARAVLEALGPRGVWLVCDQAFDSVAEAESFLGGLT